MPVPLLVAMVVGQAVNQAIGQHQAAKQNERAQTLESQNAAQDRELQREEDAQKQKAYQQALDADQHRWDDYIHANEPMWRAGAGMLSSLYNMAGVRGGPAPSMPTAGTPPPSAGAAPVTSAPASLGRTQGPQAPITVQSRMPSLMDIAQMAQLAGRYRSPMPAGDALGMDPGAANV